jgi:hypothetical protein
MPFFSYICKCGNNENDKFVTKHDTIIICNICNSEMSKKPSSCNFSIEPAAK